ncbi:uncharacterized protein SCDLUD_000756 [Saccharomycodes ludwigii]|uniref:uncharacterized protein n=1 Tax=Saccharomycodes ludwigii TaxID=36035 RepID=UPI001E840A8B|nr:hypothetical protein SCDLUD_000756 [Saccharomycodes ludwigii]KAH3903143.1 hypothetical protein SCDLUD_000756 [Saccharomycodes ludwigii]
MLYPYTKESNLLGIVQDFGYNNEFDPLSYRLDWEDNIAANTTTTTTNTTTTTTNNNQVYGGLFITTVHDTDVDTGRVGDGDNLKIGLKTPLSNMSNNNCSNNINSTQESPFLSNELLFLENHINDNTVTAGTVPKFRYQSNVHTDTLNIQNTDLFFGNCKNNFNPTTGIEEPDISPNNSNLDVSQNNSKNDLFSSVPSPTLTPLDVISICSFHSSNQNNSPSYNKNTNTNKNTHADSKRLNDNYTSGGLNELDNEFIFQFKDLETSFSDITSNNNPLYINDTNDNNILFLDSRSNTTGSDSLKSPKSIYSLELSPPNANRKKIRRKKSKKKATGNVNNTNETSNDTKSKSVGTKSKKIIFGDNGAFKKVSDSRLSAEGLAQVLKLKSAEEARNREKIILNILEKDLHFPLGYKTWVRDTTKEERDFILSGLHSKLQLIYPEYDKPIIETVIRRATYYMMQSRLRRERRAKQKQRLLSEISDHDDTDDKKMKEN